MDRIPLGVVVEPINLHRCDIAVVAVHLFEEMPDVDPERAKFIRWKTFSDLLVTGISMVSWPVIYQLDYVDQAWYYKNVTTKLDNCIFGPRNANSNLVLQPKDFVSTSDEQTKQLLLDIDPAIVMVCGLHKDLCVKGTYLGIQTQQREYFISDGLSFTLKETKDE